MTSSTFWLKSYLRVPLSPFSPNQNIKGWALQSRWGTNQLSFLPSLCLLKNSLQEMTVSNAACAKLRQHMAWGLMSQQRGERPARGWPDKGRGLRVELVLSSRGERSGNGFPRLRGIHEEAAGGEALEGVGSKRRGTLGDARDMGHVPGSRYPGEGTGRQCQDCLGFLPNAQAYCD